MANAHDPHLIHIREGLEGDRDGDEYLLLEIMRRTLPNRLQLPLPGGAVESLCSGVDG